MTLTGSASRIAWMARWVRAEAGILLVFLAGTALRAFRLRSQVLVDDEWHAVHKLLSGDYISILKDFGWTDHSIPLTLFYRLMSDTAGLTETVMRLPALMAGGLALLAVPLLARNFIDRRSSLVLAWLLAISPLHVFFSRYARPYSIVVLLSFAALIAFYRWWSGASGRWRLVYVLCAVAAPWFHLSCTPVVLAPPAFALNARLLHRDPFGRSVREILATGLAAVAGLTLLLILPTANMFSTLSVKLGKGAVNVPAVLGAWELTLGTTSPWMALLLTTGIGLGVLAMARSRPGPLAYLGFALVAQLAALQVLKPDMLAAPIVLARYCIVLLPVLLAWLALGLTEIDSLLKRRAVVSFAPVVTLAVIASLTLHSPLWVYAYRPNNFTGHAYLQFAFNPKLYLKCFQPATVPEFYRDLGRRKPGSLLVVEAPWYFHWHSLAYYQMIHRQSTMIGFVDTHTEEARIGEIPVGRPGITFANALHVSDHELLWRRGVTYVIFHKKLTEETLSPFGDQPIDIDHWVRQYTAVYGLPVYDDDWLTVFDVQRQSHHLVHARRSAAGSSASSSTAALSGASQSNTTPSATHAAAPLNIVR